MAMFFLKIANYLLREKLRCFFCINMKSPECISSTTLCWFSGHEAYICFIVVRDVLKSVITRTFKCLLTRYSDGWKTIWISKCHGNVHIFFQVDSVGAQYSSIIPLFIYFTVAPAIYTASHWSNGISLFTHMDSRITWCRTPKAWMFIELDKTNVLINCRHFSCTVFYCFVYLHLDLIFNYMSLYYFAWVGCILYKYERKMLYISNAVIQFGQIMKYNYLASLWKYFQYLNYLKIFVWVAVHATDSTSCIKQAKCICQIAKNKAYLIGRASMIVLICARIKAGVVVWNRQTL